MWDGSPITKSVKQQYKAEARFLRAWYYAMLLRHYGGVPLIGDNIYEVDDDMKTSRDTYADCVEYIVNECVSWRLVICLISFENKYRTCYCRFM